MGKDNGNTTLNRIKFIDYYALLGVSLNVSNEELVKAYKNKCQQTTDESTLEELYVAYTILSSQHRRKPAYDRELAKYNASEDKDNYYIQDSWLSYEIYNILQARQNQQETVPKKTIKSRCLRGCLNIIFFFFLMIFVTQVKRCTRRTMVEKEISYNSTKEDVYNQVENTAVNEVEAKLTKAALEQNMEYPKQLEDGIIADRVELPFGAFSYCYTIDDILFDKVISISSKEKLLSNLKALYGQMKPMIDMLITTNRGINYRYTNKSKTRTHTVYLTVEDLKELG